jgi:uncharacterized protein (TIGR02246 family)
MKSKIASSVVAFLMACLAGGTAVKAQDATKKSASDVESVLKQMEQDWTTAEINKDMTAFDRILADDWIQIDWEGKTDTKKQWLEFISSPDFKITTARIVEMKVRRFGNVAVVTGVNEEKSTIRGNDTSGRYGWTDVFAKRGGRWQAVASQVTPVPNPADTAIASAEPHSVPSSNEIEIRALYDRWAQAFEARDIDGIMSVYAPGDEVVAYDVVPPLQYKGKDAYRKDYLEFLGQYDGPIHVEYRDMRILSSGDVGLIRALERFTGKLKTGQPFDMWLRATSGLRKIDGKWFIVHDHVSVPVDFETGKALLDLKPQ